jgi:hypothetical protein
MSKIVLKKGRRKTSVSRSEVRSVVGRILSSTQKKLNATLIPVKARGIAKHPAAC